jgi:hypothetical protein
MMSDQKERGIWSPSKLRAARLEAEECCEFKGRIKKLETLLEIERTCNIKQGAPAPCGHPGYLSHTEDGGKHIKCYVCELAATQQLLASVQQTNEALVKRIGEATVLATMDKYGGVIIKRDGGYLNLPNPWHEFLFPELTKNSCGRYALVRLDEK